MDQQTKLSPIAKFYTAILIVIVAAGGFFGGFYFGVWQTIQDEYDVPIFSIADEASQYLAEDTVDTALFWKIWQEVTETHIAPAGEQTAFYGALKGMVDSLDDPYSVFWNPSETEDFTQELQGSFEGIGAEIGIKEETLTVIAPLPGSPAEKAGLRSQDAILAIDGADTRGMTLEQAIQHIRGEEGTEVVLTIRSQGEEQTSDISITRGVIELESITWEMLDNDIAYVEVSHFNEDTDTSFKKIANDIILEDPAGIILDLRNNPGGYLDSAVNIAGEFIEQDVIVIEDFGDRQKPYSSSGNASLAGIDTAVLVNGGSASAAEIVAGALQDYHIATVIGEQTFGKGSVQDFQEFSDGSSLKLTVARWLTPEGRSIENNGITPDIQVGLTQEDYDANADPQLESAVRLLLE